MFALVAATRRALRCCGNRRQRSKCSNPLVCKRSLTNRTHSRAHDRHVEHPHPCSARNPGSISRRLKRLHESCVPRLYAAASLKPAVRTVRGPASSGVPRLYAAASLKRHESRHQFIPGLMCSAALCRGLIEAVAYALRSVSGEAACSAALCRGLIEASFTTWRAYHHDGAGVPRLYAAASLKRTRCGENPTSMLRACSAALCRGLIEAETGGSGDDQRWKCSAALCRGLIEARSERPSNARARSVFRGFMPRPH